MIQIWNANEVTLKNLQNYFTNAGLCTTIVRNRELWVRATDGLHFVFTLSSGLKLMRVSAKLLIDESQPKKANRELVRSLNARSAMPIFTLKNGHYLAASFVVGYKFGIIVEQLHATFLLFISQLDSIARDHIEDGVMKTWFFAEPGDDLEIIVKKIFP